VLGVGSATRIYLAPGTTDMRKGFEGLFGLVRDQLQCDPLSGHMFLFSNARRTRLKILFWDRSGMFLFSNARRTRLKILFWDRSGLWVCAKRLEKGRFHWPESSDAQARIVLSHEQFAMLLGGIDLSQARPRRWYRRVSEEEPATTRNTL
jgi:transposase